MTNQIKSGSELKSCTAPNILDYETVALDDSDNTLVIINQTKLPYKVELLKLKTKEEIWHAINRLEVRGAPAIGIAAAIGIYVLARHIPTNNFEVFIDRLEQLTAYLNSARPTAVNLAWALNRMREVALASYGKTITDILAALRREALAIKSEDIAICKRIGQNALTLVKPKAGLLTHCNAGQLATAKYGTATAVMYLGAERGYDFRIYADETRPLLQGARLTAYELSSAGMDVTLICDNMASIVMSKGLIDAVFVGCDRVAANGDVANKIGTSALAILAKHYNIPFYVAAPSSTIDLNTPTGQEIPIEERPSTEVTHAWYANPMTLDGVKVYNPAFDITDNSLITAIITESGILKPPYLTSLKNILR